MGLAQRSAFLFSSSVSLPSVKIINWANAFLPPCSTTMDYGGEYINRQMAIDCGIKATAKRDHGGLAKSYYLFARDIQSLEGR